MRVLLILGLALLFTLALADHYKGRKKQDKDDHDHKHEHDHDHPHGHDRRHRHHKKGEHHGRRHHHHHHTHNESLPCHKIAPYNSKFAFDLYRQVALDHPSENIALSPISISTAFAFLSLGAEAETCAQILEGLGFNTSEISEPEIHEGFHQLLDILNDTEKELQLNNGNALFISNKHTILETFLEEAKRLFHSEAFSTDFKNNEEATNQINSYVEKNSQGKIAKLLDSVDQDAIFVLINYIHFRGKWENPFDEQYTKEGDFHVNADTTVKVPFMSRTGLYKVASTDDATVVAIPYKGSANALFILPNEGKLSEVEQNFNKESIFKWKKSMQRQLVDLYLPKFSVSGTVNLKETLSKFGIVDVFSDNADLSGITGESNVKLSKAVHKAVLNVDEKGTEAAGSTALEAVPMMLPPRIRFDRPFVFTMYDYTTKSILFSGRVANPLE